MSDIENETEGKSASELLALLNDELAGHDICKGVSVLSVMPAPFPERGPNWIAEGLRGSGTTVLPDCKRAFIAAVVKLQNKYHLLTDA
jgi:hypothetical protein